MASTSGKKQSVTVAKRLEILQKLEEGISVDQLAVEYGVSKRTIRRYKKDSASIRQLSENPMCINSKRQRSSLYENMESQLYKWVLKRQALGDTLTNVLLQKKAKELHTEYGNSTNFTASQGWLSRFKNRYNIHIVSIYGEKVDASDFAVQKFADEVAAQKFADELAEVLLRENFDQDNIYNMNDSVLMWKALPTEALMDKDKQPAGTTMRKDRVTVAFCFNATGKHKLPLLFINKHPNPKALKHCKHILPVIYKYESNSWINEHIFSDWYVNHFKVNVRQHQSQQGRMGKVLLLVDDTRGHTIPKEMQEDDYFKLMFLPASTFHFVQPMDQGVIVECKKLFRYELLRSVLPYNCEIKEFYANYDVKDCIDLISESWNKLTEESIRSSWGKLLKQQLPVESIKTESFDADIDRNLELNNIITSEQIAEWMCKCEEMESIVRENIKQEEHETNTSSPHCLIEEEEIDNMFHNLTKWARMEPEFIQLHAKALIDYYDKK